ncbi:hypothetical protein GP486_007375 [Trichoglossum hirsutum]|uniref:Uncharacterized protein n=1 Tax=Trichoglossum hirsutum TaxID=265104 RepID=A0A9P8L4X3_9PEZI|nr:hypothetical protein GP486_007375 [Trichoglossum hirsutum]
MPYDAKEPISCERTPAAPGAEEQAQSNPQLGHAKPPGYLLLKKRLRQQTLTQIDFVSHVPKAGEEEEADLNLIGDEEASGDIVEGDHPAAARKEQAAALAPPTTPRKKRRLEVPSSHSPPDSPFSPVGVQSPKSPLAVKTAQLPPSPGPGTAKGVQRGAGSGVAWEIEDSQFSLVSLLPDGQDAPEDAAVARPEAQDTRPEQDADSGATTQGGLERPDAPHETPAVAEIRDSDDETDYDFGPETQALALAYLPDPPPSPGASDSPATAPDDAAVESPVQPAVKEDHSVASSPGSRRAEDPPRADHNQPSPATPPGSASQTQPECIEATPPPLDTETDAAHVQPFDFFFETPSQLLPASLMNDSLPLPPPADFSFFFSDEEDG